MPRNNFNDHRPQLNKPPNTSQQIRPINPPKPINETTMYNILLISKTSITVNHFILD